jgi:hypothetical protein
MVPVPPLLALTLGMLGAAFIVKHFAKEWQKAKADVDRDEAVPVEEAKSEAVPKLRRDPQTGIYRP